MAHKLNIEDLEELKILLKNIDKRSITVEELKKNHTVI